MKRARDNLGPNGRQSSIVCHRVDLTVFAAVLPMICPILANCGFTPLYAQPGVSTTLSHVAIETPPHSRTGYLLREQLDDELGRSRGEPPLYNLSLAIDERRFARGVRVNNVASRYEVVLNVSYVLSDLSTSKTLLQGSALADVSYDSADAPYAAVAASQDGYQRAANQAAIRIRTDLSRWLTAHPR